MSTRGRWRHKGRREGGGFAAIPHAVIDSKNWRQCSGTAIKLLCCLLRQYNGHNNGDLCAALPVLKTSGWTSADVVTGALKELKHYGLLLLTKQGGLSLGPSLYAVTWRPIDECRGKLEVPASKLAPGDWKLDRSRHKRPPKKRKTSPPSGAEAIRHPERDAA